MPVGGPGEFGERLRRLRIAAGLTQEALAEQAGLSARGIADLERGARRFPRAATVRRLADALGLSAEDRAGLIAAGQKVMAPSVSQLSSAPTAPAASPRSTSACRDCGRANEAGARFCIGCGAVLDPACPHCLAAADPLARFCGACGGALIAPAAVSPTPPMAEVVAGEESRRAGGESDRSSPTDAHPTTAVEGEHKQVTVLCCHLADAAVVARTLGSERMLEHLDRFLKVAEEEIERFGGAVSTVLSDGLVAVFGAPMAHEDHARRCVLAALGIQRRLRQSLDAGVSSPRLSTEPVDGPTRISVNTGLVAVGYLGSGGRRRPTIVGEATTVAGALQPHVPPGTILITDATARQVTGYVRLDPLAPVRLAGLAEPVTVFRVIGVGPRRSPIEGLGARPLTQFVGRDRELGALHDLLAQVAAAAPEIDARPSLSHFIGRDDALAALRGPLAKVEAGHGQVVGLVGEPGIGKSRLLYEFRRSLGDKRITYLEGRCLSYGSTIPYLPILDLVRANCGIQDGDEPAAVIEKVRFGLQEVGLDPDEHAPYIVHLLGTGDAPAPADLSPEALKLRIVETLRAWSLRGSQQRPIIFAVEDLHWIDGSSEEYLASLAESLAGAPILLVCTWRPGYRPPWAEHSYVTQLALRRLSADESLRVVRSVLHQQRVPDALAEAILGRAEGNPFFLEELARAVMERGETGAETLVPDTIQGVLMARMDRLPDITRRVLQTASVLGREVPLRLLGAVWQDAAPLHPHIRELQRLEFLYEQAGRESRVVFKHALTQDVAYGTLLTGRRRMLHAEAGRALEALYTDRLEEVYDRLAHHYARTDDAPKAVEYLTRFAGKAAQIHAHGDAAHALEEALEHAMRLPADVQDRHLVKLAVPLAASYYFLGRFGDTVALLERYQPHLARVGDLLLTGRFYFELAHAYSHLGNYQQAVECAGRAIAAAERAEDHATWGKAHYVLCKESMWVSSFAEGLEHGRRAVEHLNQVGERWWLGQSVCWQGINLYFMGDLNAALACAAHGYAIGEELGDHRLQSYAAWNHAWFAATRGDGEAAVAWGHRSIRLSPDPLNNAFSLGWTGYAYLELGDAAHAIQLLDQSIELLAAMRYSRLVGWFKGWLAEALLLHGDLARGLVESTLGTSISRETGFTWAVGLSQRAMGRVERARGNLAEAERWLTEALKTFEAIHSRFDAGRTHLDLADLAHAQGQPQRADAHVAEAEQRFAALDLPSYLGRVRQDQGRDLLTP
jgi:class 3 adenylate cyclase/transcriptional regulator with XRE-family HTH domain/tetratricopeptide (TPR) repeat protein